MIGPVMITLLMAALAALAGVARWVTFRRAVRSGRFDDPVGAIFAVWLDRGELEKLMTASREEGGYDAAPPPRDPRRDDERRYEDRRYEERRFDERPRDRHDGDGYGYRKKKRGFDIFDIFD